MTCKKIISGGQSGVDRAALDAALRHGFPCGGSCPPGRLAEDGPIDESYPLIEMTNGGYRKRTIQNVLDSDGTVVIYFGDLSGGTEQTAIHCSRRQKPVLTINAEMTSPGYGAELVSNFIELNSVAILNVAGPRARKVPAAYDYTYELISQLVDLNRC